MSERSSRTVIVAWVVGVVAVLGASATPARAQVAPVARSLSVQESVQLALDQSPRVAEARARQAAAESMVTALRALAMPTASVQAQYLRQSAIPEVRIPDGTGGTRVLFPNLPNTLLTRADVLVPIYSFGRVGTNVAAADAEVTAAVAEVRGAEAAVRLDVMRAYWALATARENARVLVEALARVDAWVSDVRARVDAGVLPPNDLLSAQAQRARQSVRLVQARNEAAVAELNLARLVGVPAGSALQTSSPVGEALPQAEALSATPVTDLVARATGARAERASLVAHADGLRQAAKATIANLNPYVTAGASIAEARPNARYVPPVDDWRFSWNASLNVVWPLFDSGRLKAQAAGQRAQADAVDARRADFDALVALDIRQRLLEVEAGHAALAASAEGIAAAAEARRVVEERFRAGVATSTEVLDAQVALLEAELERTRLSAALRVSEALLLYAVGAR